MNNSIKTLLFLLVYPWYKWRYYKLKNQFPNVCSSHDTLSLLIKEKKSLSRFGDGELNLISGKGIGFQNPNDKLSARLKEIIQEENHKCYIAIPDVFNGLKRFKLDAKCFWLYTVVSNWNRWSKFIRKRNYLDTQCSRFYMDIKNKKESMLVLEQWKELWNEENLVIIEGTHTKMGVGSELFNNTKSIRRIICPDKNAFDSYDRIMEAAGKLEKDCLIIIALGPTATVLAYDLSNFGYRAIDTGHLDLEYNWMQLNATKKIAVAGRFVNEISNSIISEIKDETYSKQIIAEISN